MSAWERHEGVTCVECPKCAFTFDADHEDMQGGYSCPVCRQAELERVLRREIEFMEAFPDVEDGSPVALVIETLRLALAHKEEG